MMIECPYSTKTREILANPKKYLEMSLGFHGRDISRVSGNLSVVGDGFPNTSLVSMEHGYSKKKDDMNDHCMIIDLWLNVW